MSHTFEVAFAIGAALQSGFKASIGQAVSQVNKLGKEVAALGAQKNTAQKFQDMAARVESTRVEMKKAQDRVRELKNEISATSNPTKQLTQQMASAQERSKQLKTRWKAQKASLQGLKSELNASGISTRNLAAEQNRLAKAYDHARKAKERLSNAAAKHEGIKSRRSELRGSMFDAVAPVAAFAAPIKAAVVFESKMADVKKVVDEKIFQGLGKDLLKMSTEIPMAVDGLADISAAAGQSGLFKTKQGLLDFAKKAAIMGVAFDMAGDESGKMMTAWRSGMKLTQDQAVDLGDAVNHLSNNMASEAKDISEVLQRQGSVAKAAGLTEIQASALSSALLSGGSGSDIAATALKNLTGAMTKGKAATKSQKEAFKALGFGAVEMAKKMQKNAPDAIKEVFQALKEAPEEEQNALVSQLFGEESKGAIAPLLANLDNLAKAFDLVSDKVKYAGSMQAEYDVRSKTTANNLELLKNRTAGLGVSVGSVLLPGINALTAPLGAVLDKAAWLADTFPGLTTAVVGLGAGLAVTGLAINAGAYAFTFYSGAVARAKVAIEAFRTGKVAATIAEKAHTIATWASAAATKVITVAQWAWNAALTANPIGLVVVGIAAFAAGAVLVYKKWEPIKKFFADLWKKLKGMFDAALKFIGIIPGMGEKAKAAVSEANNLFSLESGGGRKLAKAAAGGGGITQNNNMPVNVTVNGGDPQAVTRAVQSGINNSVMDSRRRLAQERRLAYE